MPWHPGRFPLMRNRQLLKTEQLMKRPFPFKSRLSLCVVSLLLCLPFAPTFAAETPPPPNILLILADDLGYGDLSCNGGKIPTPNIDSIAKNGMSFKEGYVTAPQCAPSRAGLLTGRYQQKFGFEYNGDEFPNYGLPIEEKTMADYLRAAGYHTGIIGKWHLGVTPLLHPLRRGFDEFFGFLAGASHYLSPNGKSVPGLMRNEKPEQVTSYLTDVFGEEASAFIEKNKDKPWFLYLSFNAPHEPYEATQKYLDRFPEVSDVPINYPSGRGCRSERIYAAMVSALDDAVGRTLQTLKDLHLDGKTVIVFLSDSGAPICVAQPASNGPLRGEKGDILEGGIRVPFLVQWSGHIPAGAKIQSPTSTLDLLPTFLEMAGKSVPSESKFDGQSLLSTLATGKEPRGDRTLCWMFRLGPNKAIHSWGIRQGPWKFWRGPERAQDGKQLPDMAISPKTALFDIENDIHEDRDLSAQNPEKKKALETALAEWMQTLQPPKWGSCAGVKAPLPEEQ